MKWLHKIELQKMIENYILDKLLQEEMDQQIYIVLLRNE